MGGLYNIKETKEFLAFVLSLGSSVGFALEDGKIGITDARYLMAPLMKAGPAFNDLGLIPKELGELDDAEKRELTDFAQAEFDIPQEDVEVIVDEALATCIQLYSLVQKIIAATKKKEAPVA